MRFLCVSIHFYLQTLHQENLLLDIDGYYTQIAYNSLIARMRKIDGYSGGDWLFHSIVR